MADNMKSKDRKPERRAFKDHQPLGKRAGLGKIIVELVDRLVVTLEQRHNPTLKACLCLSTFKKLPDLNQSEISHLASSTLPEK
jgi:hypothetical protein